MTAHPAHGQPGYLQLPTRDLGRSIAFYEAVFGWTGDPDGTRLGLVAPVRTARAQPLLAVRDVEASSAWYQHVLGLVSDHGGPEYERLLADGVLVLQLHRHDVTHHHGPVVDDPDAPLGNGVLVWFGEVTDFDGAVERAGAAGAPVVRPPHPAGGRGQRAEPPRGLAPRPRRLHRRGREPGRRAVGVSPVSAQARSAP